MCNTMDKLFKKILLTLFSPEVAKAIYGFVIDVIAFFWKIWIYLTLPFVFVREFCQLDKEQIRKEKEQKEKEQ